MPTVGEAITEQSQPIDAQSRKSSPTLPGPRFRVTHGSLMCTAASWVGKQIKHRAEHDRCAVTRLRAYRHLAGWPGRSWTEGLPSCGHGVAGRGEDPAILLGERIASLLSTLRFPSAPAQRVIPG